MITDCSIGERMMTQNADSTAEHMIGITSASRNSAQFATPRWRSVAATRTTSFETGEPTDRPVCSAIDSRLFTCDNTDHVSTILVKQSLFVQK